MMICIEEGDEDVEKKKAMICIEVDEDEDVEKMVTIPS